MMLSLAVALLDPVHAECKGTYTSDQLLGDVQSMSTSLRIGDDDALVNTGKRVEAGLPCMAEPIPPGLFASVYRMLGVAAITGGDAEKAARWFRTARELDPTFQWDVADLEQGTAAYAAYEAARPHEGTAPVAVPGKSLVVPANSKLIIDGRPLTKAEATPDRYHLVQQVAADKSVRASWLIVGNELPDRLLQEQVTTLNEEKAAEETQKEEKKKKKEDPEVLAGGYTTDEVVTIERERPPAKTPLIVAGGLAVAGAAGMYAASFSTNQAFQDATTTDDLMAAKQLTNTLVLASAGTLLVGAGVGWYGVVLADGGVGLGTTIVW